MTIKFLGAAGTVTGSCYLLTADSGEQILIDLGLFLGPADIDALNYQPLELDSSRVSGVILTHAHLDHCGRLPLLEKTGFRKNIFMTAPTSELTQLSLLDSAKINKEDHPEDVLFDEDEVYSTVAKFESVTYGRPFHVGGFQVTYRDAGHIIGSASIEIGVDGKNIVFSGDLGNTPEGLTQPTELIASADLVVMESTYGDRSHPPGQAIDVIRSEINAVEKTGGTLLIPAFSLDRTQEVLHIISHLKSQKLVEPETSIFLDSPMARKATAIYDKYRSFLNREINADFRNANPFSFPGLKTIYDIKDSYAIAESPGSKVIIAGSGMMTGGRIVNHALRLLPLPTTRLLIVGYQGEGTLGRLLQSGADRVTIGKTPLRVRASVTDTQVLSSHADQPRLLKWLGSIQGVNRVILTHGEDGPRSILADKIKADLNISDVAMPVLHQELSL